MKIGTHSGRFHADELVAIAELLRMFPGATIIRSRDPERLRQCDIVVDIGGGPLDHHQPGGAGERENGIPYAAAGLVLRLYGAMFCGSAAVAARVDREFVQAIDEWDVRGHVAADVPTFHFSEAVAALNPAWNDDWSQATEDAAFMRALALASTVLDAVIVQARATEAAGPVVAAAAAAPLARSAGIMVLDRPGVPWDAWMHGENGHVRVVVAPEGQGGWAVKCVALRGAFPASWKGAIGLEGEALSAALGVEGLRYNRGFVVGTADLGAALKVAERAV